MILTDDYIDLIRMQRPYVQGSTNQAVFDNYMVDVEQDYADIKDFLSTTRDLVDLGAGMGGIDFLIRTKHPNIKVNLLDGEEVEPGEHYGYKHDLKFYSNNSVARQFFTANKIDANFYAANDDLEIVCDTLISLNSWGFHYPISRYINFVAKNQPKIIILDIRPTHQNLTDLQALGYQYHSTVRTWGSKKARTVLTYPLSHVRPATT